MIILSLAIGDAIGAGYEFVPQTVVESQNKLTAYRLHALDHNPPGYTTDDTQMSLAIAEAMLDNVEWTPLNIANYFVAAFKRDPRMAYSKGFLGLLMKVTDGKELLDAIKPHSERNGAAMRSCPLGYEPDIDALLHMSEIQAKVTHDTVGGVSSSQAVALATHFGLYGHLEDYKDVGELVCEYVRGPWKEKWSGRVPCHGVKTAQAVFHVLRNSSTLSEVLTNAIALGGDTDSTASVAMGCAASSGQYENDMPQFLWNDLEKGKYGREYFVELDFRLWNKYGVGKPDTHFKREN